MFERSSSENPGRLRIDDYMFGYTTVVMKPRVKMHDLTSWTAVLRNACTLRSSSETGAACLSLVLTDSAPSRLRRTFRL
jgi:hypothetical protein